MWRHLRTIVCCALLCVGLGVAPLNASESRITTFSLSCDGSEQFVNFTVTGLGTASTRFIQGAEISLFQKDGALKYILIFAVSDPNRNLITMGMNDTHVARDFTGFYSAPNNGGSMSFLIDGVCTGGGQVKGIAVINFFS